MVLFKEYGRAIKTQFIQAFVIFYMHVYDKIGDILQFLEKSFSGNQDFQLEKYIFDII